MTLKALILLADGFEDTEALCTADVLKRGGFVVDTASVRTAQQLAKGGNLERGHVTTSAYAELKITPTVDVDAHNDAIMKANYDILVLPGGLPGATNLAESATVINLLKHQQQSKKWIGAICAAPVEVLKKKQLLSSTAKVVCYPAMSTHLGDHKAATDKTTHVDTENKLITSSGPATAMEFALTIVATLTDKANADKVAQGLLYRHSF